MTASACGRSNSKPSSNGAGEGTQTAQSSVTAAGPLIRGTGYSFHAPPNWRDVTSVGNRPAAVDRAAASTKSVHGFPSSVNIVLSRGGLDEAALSTMASNLEKSMRATAPRYVMRQNTKIAGLTAKHLSGLRSTSSKHYWLEQFIVGRTQHTYVITFTFSSRLTRAQRNDVIGSVFAGWQWT
jgi:hypothetical protein